MLRLNINLLLPAATSFAVSKLKSPSLLAISLVTNLPNKLAIPFNLCASVDLGENSLAFLPSIIPKAYKKSAMFKLLFNLKGYNPEGSVVLSCLV